MVVMPKGMDPGETVVFEHREVAHVALDSLDFVPVVARGSAVAFELLGRQVEHRHIRAEQ